MILERLRQSYDDMSPTYRRIAEFIAENYGEVAFMSGAELARACGVHESVVVKFAISLGYSGYPDMLREIQTAAKGFMEPSAREDGDTDPLFAAYRSLLLAGASFLRESVKQEAGPFVDLVNAALAADRIHVVGFCAEASLAMLTMFQLDMLNKRVALITDSGVELHRKLHYVTEGDLVICFSFSPHLVAARTAVDLAKKKGATCAVFTDGPDSPVAAGADIVLYVDPAGKAEPAERHVLATSIVSGCATAISLLDRERALASLDQLDELLAKYQIHTPQT